MNKDEFISLFEQSTEEKLVEVSLTSEVKLLKKSKKDENGNSEPNNLGPIFKNQTIKLLLNANYEYLVNEARVKNGMEPDFKAEERKWGEKKGSIIRHNDAVYLTGIYKGKTESFYTNQNGEVVEYESFSKFVSSAKPSEKPLVEVRTIKFDSIKNIVFGVDE